MRALVLAGEGRGFCSGGDVDEIIGATLAMDTAQLLDFNRMTGQVVRAVRECPFPVIAAVHGVAAGAGAVLALAADFRVADPSARFAFLFTRVGLSGGDMGAAYLLPRVVGLGHATRLLMLGEPVRAPEAERIGLISELTDEGEARRGRRRSGPPARRRPGARATPRPRRCSPPSWTCRSPPPSRLDAATQALLMNGEDYAEFHAAFTEKRPPKWQGQVSR